MDHFPTHDAFKKQINTSFNEYRTRLFFGFLFGNYMKYMQPLNFIANYYGEKMGFYFAYLLFYTSWLLPVAIVGIALFIFQMAELKYQYYNNEEDGITVDNPFNCLYCIIMAVWSTIFIEVWKRREFEIGLLWNMNTFKGED